MAKLNVIIPVADVEINGAKYRKVDRSAQEGDVIRITDEDAPRYVVNGAFYAVDEVDSCGDAQITDEDGDGCDTCNLSFEVYEKVTELAPQQYREVKRKATVGERIRIVDKDRSEDGYENGAEFTVTDAYYGGDLYVNDTQFVLYREYVVLEPVAAETATQPAQPERLRVGEYAKVISVGVIDDSTPESWVKVGDVFEITTDDGSSTPFRGKQVLSGETAWFKAERFVRATDDEVAAAKYALKLGDFKGGGYAVIENPSDDNASTGVRLSKGKYVIVSEFGPEGVRALTIENPDSTTLGFANADALRKVTKEEFDAATAPKPTFEVGDTVKLSLTEGQRPKHGFGEVENGDIGKVASVSNSLITVDFPSQSGWSAKPNELTKLTAEESAEIERNKAEEAAREAERAKWAKIGREVNEFKRGDIVEVMESGSSGYRVGLVDVVTHGDDDVLRLSTGTDRTCPWIVSRRVKLVVPVEQRFDQSA